MILPPLPQLPSKRCLDECCSQSRPSHGPSLPSSSWLRRPCSRMGGGYIYGCNKGERGEMELDMNFTDTLLIPALDFCIYLYVLLLFPFIILPFPLSSHSTACAIWCFSLPSISFTPQPALYDAFGPLRGLCGYPKTEKDAKICGRERDGRFSINLSIVSVFYWK